MKRAAAILFLFAAGLLALAVTVEPARSTEGVDTGTEQYRQGYRGAESCRPCHHREFTRWQASAHARSTEEATAENLPPEIVKGETVSHPPGKSTFSRKGDEFFIETTGPDGAPHEYPVTHIVGPVRLNMFLTEMEDGRLQVLPLLRDIPAKQWFDYTVLIFGVPNTPFEEAPTVKPGEPSFWTGPIRAYDNRCGRCHTSGRQIQAPRPDGKGMHEVWHPLEVDCEACHGPGAAHNEYWRRLPVDGEKDPIFAYWPATREIQQSMCLWCHMESEVIQPDWRPGEDVFEYLSPTLLDDPERLDAAGRPHELVYDGLPFLLSACAKAGGLTCVSCHDPHGSGRHSDLVVPIERTYTLCTKCHGEIAADPAAHSHHDMTKSGGRCVSCHMPFLTIERGHGHVRDHTIGSPMPELGGGRVTTDACTWCHSESRGRPDDSPLLDRSEVVSAYWRWYPNAKIRPSWVKAIAGAREPDPRKMPAGTFDRAPQVFIDLEAVARNPDNPRLARASAAKLLGKFPDRSLTYLIGLLEDEDSLVRRAAAAALASIRHPDADAALFDALSDPSFAVRVAAARAALSGWNRVRDNPELLAAILPVLEADTAAVPLDDLRWFRLGAARQLAGDREGAVAAYEKKLALDPYAANVRRAVERLKE